jgi:PAS domain S-box-containing protein/putative nucleotidyltransferase with HDIG domain
LRIALLYMCAAGAWVVFSDRLLNYLVQDPLWLTQLQTYKGCLFVVFMGALLYVERLWAERAMRHLRELVQQKALLFDQAPNPMWVLDAQTARFLAVNDAAVNIYGYSRVAFMEMSLAHILPANAQLLTLTASALMSVRRHVCKDGAAMDVDVHVRRMTYEGQAAWLMSVSDITPRERARHGLTLAQFSLDHSPIPVLRVAWDGTILYVNEATLTVFALTREQISQLKIWQAALDLNAQEWQSYCEWVRERGTDEQVIEVQITGAPMFVVINSSYFCYDGAEYLTLHCIDVTERKRAVEALQSSEERYRAISELISDYAFSFRIEAGHRMVHEWTTEAYTRITGYQPLDAKNEQGWALTTYPEDEPIHQRHMQMLLSGQSVVSEYRINTRNGQVRWQRVYSKPVCDETGAVKRVYGAAQDISAQKEAEALIRQQLDEMTALHAATRELTEPVDMNALAHTVVRSCVETFGACLASVAHVEADGRVVILAQYPGAPYDPRDFTVRWDDVPTGQGLTGQAIRSGLPAICTDLLGDPAMVPWAEAMHRYGFQAKAVLPLISHTHTFGVLSLCSPDRDFFTPQRMQLIQSYAFEAAFALENARLLAETERRLTMMRALHRIDTAITSSLDLRANLDIVLEQAQLHLGVAAADVLLLDASAQTLSFAGGRGLRTGVRRGSHPDSQPMTVALGDGTAGRAALERQTVLTDVESLIGAPCARDAAFYAAHGFVMHLATPLIAQGRVKGVLEFWHDAPLTCDEEWLSFMQLLAGQAVVAIENASMVQDLQRSNAELKGAYEATIEGWSRTMDLRDRETEGHTQRVAETTMLLAQAMGVNEGDLVQIRRGALLHDIGKMAIPDPILLKPSSLNAEEMDVMRRHPRHAFELLSRVSFLHPALDIPYAHHEKWDGTGYPRGLKGEQIPLAARIFAVVDVWDALRSDRPYRQAWPEEQAREYIRAQAGIHFDPAVVGAFLRLSAPAS